MKVAWLAPRIGRDFSYLIVVPIEIALVYLFTRPALKLLFETGASPLQASVQMATYFGVIAIITQLAFILVIDHMAPDSLFQQKTVIGFLFREAVESLVGASPYIPLFIGLSVLAYSAEQVTSIRGLEKVEDAYANCPQRNEKGRRASPSGPSPTEKTRLSPAPEP